MFHQLLAPVANNLFLTLLVGFVPIVVVLILLGVLRRPAWQSALAGLIVGLLVATLVWGTPLGIAASATGFGILFALWPVMWIVWNAMWLYNIAVRSGQFEVFRRWMVYNVPPDKRILMLIIGFSFGALMEGVAGFGTPVAIGSALLIGLGYPVLDALTLTLIFDTAPVAFGALGVPITTLSGVTGLHAGPLSAMVGRQLPFFALFLPFFAIVLVAGWRGLRTAWPVALVAGGSFALTQFAVSNFIGPELPDVLAALVSLICTIVFVQFWRPRDVDEYRAQFSGAGAVAGAMGGHDAPRSAAGPRPAFAVSAGGAPGIPTGTSTPVNTNAYGAADTEDPNAGLARTSATRDPGKPSAREAVLAWLPWAMVSAVVIIWTFAKIPVIGQQVFKWPGLYVGKKPIVYLTLYHKAYPAVFSWQPLGTGTAILLAIILTWLIFSLLGASEMSAGRLIVQALIDTWFQLRWAILTVVLIIGLAYLYNYSGMAYSLGLAISSVGGVFPFFSAFLGWIACFLSGSDTSSNALFGNLQVAAARQLHLSPVLMAATNSSGAVMSKMISPQNVTTGVSTTELVGKEGLVVARTFKYSIVLAVLMGLLALAQQYVVPWMIPH